KNSWMNKAGKNEKGYDSTVFYFGGSEARHGPRTVIRMIARRISALVRKSDLLERRPRRTTGAAGRASRP
ncbi:MAG TPA: hypothetical protein VFU31_13295, partial [Candidatus Binatia bacterium]|nr:hypothetical protein [Candidatus Binatia bacterium]